MSCRHAGRTALQRALAVYAEAPNSALAILKGIDRSRLSDGERAMYALVYTASQDKSGLDVAGDSLIRLAYNHYSALPGDSLYGRCMYYMGKYYLLKDSIDRAVYWLGKAEGSAAASGDTAMQCLALEKLSKAVRKSDKKKGQYYMDKSLKLYLSYSKATVYNKVYAILGKCECDWYLGCSDKALAFGKEALAMALSLNDSAVVSDVYQDMSCFASGLGDYKNALDYARLSCAFSARPDVHKTLALADKYLKVDSLDKCVALLDTLTLKTNSLRHAGFHLRFLVALKEGDKAAILLNADSSASCLRRMYEEEMHRGAVVYSDLMAENVDRLRNENKASVYKYVLMLVGILSLCIFIIVYCIHEMREKERQHAEELHKETLRHKEMQIATLKNFIVKKVDIVSRLDTKGKSHVVLDESEWAEIELFLENVEDMFVTRLREEFASLTEDDIRLLMLLRLRIPAKVLANIYGVNEKSIRQKLFVFKEKIGLDGKGLSLRQFVSGF